MEDTHEDYISLGIFTFVIIIGLLMANAEGLMIYIVGIAVLSACSVLVLFILAIVSFSVYFKKKAVYEIKPEDYMGKSDQGRKPKVNREIKNMGISL